MITYKKRNIQGLEVLELPGDPNGMYIILFHGFGADAHDLVSLSDVCKASPRPTWIFPNGPMEVPIAPGCSGRAWFPINIDSLKKSLEEYDIDSVSDSCKMGESLISELNIPRSKLILGGFSQGAVVATEMTLTASEKVAALLILSGTLVNESKWRNRASKHAGTAFFQSHGIEDPLLPIKRAQDLEHFLHKHGLKGKLHSFHGGHEIPQPVLFQLHSFLTRLTQKISE